MVVASIRIWADEKGVIQFGTPFVSVLVVL